MGRIMEHFVVCGLGPEVQSMDGEPGFHGFEAMYMQSVLDQFPPPSKASQIPPQLPVCVLPTGVELYPTGPAAGDEASLPRSYPIVLTEGDGSKIYVSCVAFRDRIDEDIALAYEIPPSSYVDKCICIVSHTPCFQVFREVLEEIHRLCFSSSGCSKPLWDLIRHIVMNVPVPDQGSGSIIFGMENYLLSVKVPSEDGLPHADLSFQPLVQCLDVDNIIRLFSAVFLERHVLLRASKYSLLTIVAESICHLLYPIKWQHVYIPVLFVGGVDYLGAPTPYLMGLHSSVDTSEQPLDTVMVVDLDRNTITCMEDIPMIPEPELGQLRTDLVELLHPNLVDLDRMQESIGCSRDSRTLKGNKSWSSRHDTELRLIFLKFFATLLSGYRDFVEKTAEKVFNKEAFLRKRSRITGVPPDPVIDEFLDSPGFHEFLEKGYGSSRTEENLMDKLQQAMSKGQNPSVILPAPAASMEILMISDYLNQEKASMAKYKYDRFPALSRSHAQEEERRKALERGSMVLDHLVRHNSSSADLQPLIMDGLDAQERKAERDRMVRDIRVKLHRLWNQFLVLESTEDPLLSSEYGTILALIESDAEGIGGSGFVECISEHINSGGNCLLTDEQFIAVKELIKTAVTLAISRNDMKTVGAALASSAILHRKAVDSVPEFIQRHLGVLPIWDELRFWHGYVDGLLETVADKSGNFATLVAEQLVIVAEHMAGLGLPDADVWFILETIARKHHLGTKQMTKLRGLLAYLRKANLGYWDFNPVRPYHSFAGEDTTSKNTLVSDRAPPPVEVASAGRNWIQNMLARAAVPNPRDMDALPQKNRPSSTMRTLRGHKAAITVLHAVCKAECGEDSDDSGHIISGSADCTVKMWDPTRRGSELQATLQGHTRAVRTISSDNVRIVTGSDDQRVLVWDKLTGKQLLELKAHNDRVNFVRLLRESCLLTASHDGTVKLWDVRKHSCIETVGRSASAILCLDCDNEGKTIAAAGMDGVCYLWDIVAGKQKYKLIGHTKWIRCVRMTGDSIITGSDDWTVREWSSSNGSCGSILTCHSGAITSVEYYASDKGIITGSADGTVRMWEKDGASFRCVKNVGPYSTSVLSIRCGGNWLGMGAADNSMSMFQRIQPSTGNTTGNWQLYRTDHQTAAVVRCAAVDPERGRICTGARNGLLRLWDAGITA